VTGIVDRLTEEGLALRVAVEGDRRAQLARLTPAGEAAFAKLAAAHEAWVNDLLGALDGPMLEQAFDLLTHIETREKDRP